MNPHEEAFLTHVFRNASLEAVGECERVFKIKTCNKRTLLFDLGDSARSVYVVRRGNIRIGRMTPDGKEITIAVLRAGAIFGEEGLFGRSVRTTIATSLDEATIWVAPADGLKSILSRHPDLAMCVANLLSVRLRDASKALEKLAYARVADRLLELFDRLAIEFGIATPAGVLLDIALTHADLAALIGSTRETVSVELSELRRLGRIAREGSRLVVTAG